MIARKLEAYFREICLNCIVIKNRVSTYISYQFLLFSLNLEKLSVECTEAPSIMEDAVIPDRPFSLEKIPVQCTEKSMPYRMFSYLERRPLQCSEMSFSRENLTLSRSAQQAVPCTEIYPPSKGDFISFGGGSVYSNRFSAPCTEISLPRWGFLSSRVQSPYMDKRRQNSSPKFDDLPSLHKRPYWDNLPVQCTEIPSSKEASTSFSEQSLKFVNHPVECTEISSLKDAFSSLRTQRSNLDKLPIQCSEISSLKDDFLSLSRRTKYCGKFPVQCTEMSSPVDDILSTSILPS